ncbi:bacterio-opsin activator HTH domain-containing protein [Halovivax asiaticus JCM 14624]|uniref:Bacterio-opsin activator HTH domain-containing protein n=1 Tax=Halovivax asiaticus JCM 14624 TaxID=1227490 RepID=M0BII9_9EURY|nr:helix-turn-helix domain-containing protein [Halovivax asiaticus]ELZ10701.1 bacterio-opsin activator HTH domain-containing protein [Halovivax asiaticus JCM 14624]
MGEGIRATVAITAPDGCPIARESARTGSVIDQTSTSVSPAASSGSVTEYLAAADEPAVDAETVDDGPDADAASADAESATDATSAADEPTDEAVFSYGSTAIYRTAHEESDGCPCACLGSYGCPVHRYVADDGELTLVFHAESFDQLQDVMGDLRERFPSVDVRRLLQPPLEGTPDDGVFVNRGKLTDRQREVLETAYENGYFERPRGANASELAAELGISQSTFTEHLVTAQRKLLDDVLDPSA